MTCPRCHSEFDEPSGFDKPSGFSNKDSVCPECGVRLLRNVSGVMKTSAVMIAAQGERGFYRSVQDVPEPLRTRLIETTTSANSGIIVIADRAGKEQLTQVMARREAGRETGHEVGHKRTEATEHRSRETAVSESQLPSISRLPWLAWAGFIGVLALAAILFEIFRNDWSTFSFHW